MIAWYVHHQGRGHRTRAASIAAHLAEPVTVLSSLAPEPAEAHLGWVELARDDAALTAPGGPVDPTARGLLHWVPQGDDGLRERMAAIAAWVAREQPRAVVVDVSAEVTWLLRLLGVPVVVVAMPGERTDAAHTAAYTAATAVVAPWAGEVYAPSWLAPHADRTTAVGAISRFAGRTDVPADRGHGLGLVLGGAGGSAVTPADLADLAAAVPGLDWQVLGPGGRWVADPWPLLRRADVVVTHAGQNALADVAAAGTPAVVVPQDRPFGEQHATAAALGAAGLAATSPSWPARDAWAGLVERGRATGGAGWSRWAPAGAAARAADVVAGVAGTPETPGTPGTSARGATPVGVPA
ncbi:hypothetical protein GCM10027047_04710 [Rhodococcus aerolatus]